MLILPSQHAASRFRAVGGFYFIYERTPRRRSPQRHYNFSQRNDFHESQQQGFYLITLSIKPKSINVPI